MCTFAPQAAAATAFWAASLRSSAGVIARPELASSSRPSLDVGALQAHDHRDLQAHFLHGRDDAFGDQVATHDAAEDVDQDGLHLVGREDQLERLGDALLGGTAADVEEVGRLAARQLDHVHRGHRQTGAVDHAADRAVHRHVVEVVLDGGRFGGVFLREVAHGGQVGVAELGVVVGVDLAVEGGEVAVCEDGQRVQLDQGEILLVEQLVQAKHDLDELVHLLRIQVHLEPEIAALVRLQAFDEIHHEGVDVFRRFGGHLLDVDAAVLGGDERDRLGVAIGEDREVQFLRDIGRVGDQDQVHRQRTASRLVGFHVGTEHALGSGADVIETAAELDATGLAATTGMDLGLDHPLRTTKVLGGVDSGIGRVGNLARRYGDAVLGEQFFSLVLVEIHSIPRANGRKRVKACRPRSPHGEGG